MAVDGQTYSCALYRAVTSVFDVVDWDVERCYCVFMWKNLKAAFYSYAVFVYCKKAPGKDTFLSLGFKTRLLSHFIQPGARTTLQVSII